MKKLSLFFFGIILLRSLFAQEGDPKAIILSHHIILYTIDSVWNHFGTYTSIFSDRTKVEVDTGWHTYEFKYPKVGFNGRVYRVSFNAESDKEYHIDVSDTNSFYPMVLDESTGLKVKDVSILRVSIPKPDDRVMKLPGSEAGNYATIVGNCCSGYIPYGKKNKATLGYIVKIDKIDIFWGPYPFDYYVSFGSLGPFQIRVPPGKHDFIIHINPSPGIYITNNPNPKALDKIVNTEYFPTERFVLTGEFEAGKSYGFAYQFLFDSFTPPYNAHHELKFVEVPESWSEE